jgi:cell division protein FtsI/penicillin-binding protein 2
MADERDSRPSARIRLVQVVLGVAIAVLAGRLLDVQVLRADQYVVQHVSQPVILQEQEKDRGSIVDRMGLLLAADSYDWELGAHPGAFRNDDERWQAAICLQELLNEPASEIQSLLRSDAEYVVLGRMLDHATAALINGGLAGLEAALALAPGGDTAVDEEQEELLKAATLCEWPLEDQVWASPYTVRLQPQGELFAHLIGLVRLDGRSYYGIEGSYGEFLRGNFGPDLSRSHVGVLPASFSIFLPSEVGYDLILTVDWRIQRLAARALERAVIESGAEAGTVIVMDPGTGAILASYSYPSYDPNRYWEYGNRGDIFTDPAVSAIYEPGSVFKVVTMGIGLDQAVISPYSEFEDPGSLEVAGRVFQNADRQAHGIVTANEILAMSLNVGIAQIGELIGKDVFYQYLPKFGFGRKGGVDLAYESDGLVKLPGDPNWSEADFVANTFGQAVSVTPLQMLTAVAAVANEGVLMRPYVVDRLVVSGEVFDVQPQIVNRAISADAARTLTEMMVSTVELGASPAMIEGVDVAGKSGTAQIPIAGRYHDEWTIASFAGFAPAYDPAFVCLVKIDKPLTDIWGGSVAAPVFGEIAPGILQILQVPVAASDGP